MDACAGLNEGMECSGHIVGGSHKVCVISVGDRVHVGVCCLDGLQRAFSHQGEKSTAERATLSDTTSRGDVDGAGWVVSEEAHCGVSAIPQIDER